MQARRARDSPSVDVEVDCFNVREYRPKIFERDGYKFAFCGKQLTRFTVILDHLTPMGEGGGDRYENLFTACLFCNSLKTDKPLGDFLADRETPEYR